MVLTKIEDTNVTVDDLAKFNQFVTDNPDIHLITGPDAGLSKRIVSVNVSGDPVVLVNPEIVIRSEQRVVYLEKNDKGKYKKTIRHTAITVSTDNMQEVEFAAEKTTKFDTPSMFEDAALYECVLVQRGIDLLNGVGASDPTVRYTSEVRMPTRDGRNSKTMLKSPNGEFKYVKNKKIKTYTDSGWVSV